MNGSHDSYDGSHHSFAINDVKEKFAMESELGLRLYDKTFLDHSKSIDYLDENASKVLLGANLTSNEYGHVLFAS